MIFKAMISALGSEGQTKVKLETTQYRSTNTADYKVEIRTPYAARHPSSSPAPPLRSHHGVR